MHEPPAARSPWRRRLAFLAALLGPPALAAGAALMALLMLAFASDAGVRDRATAERMLVGCLLALGVAGASGLPFALGVLAPPGRAPSWRFAGRALVVLGLLGAATCAVLYVRAAS